MSDTSSMAPKQRSFQVGLDLDLGIVAPLPRSNADDPPRFYLIRVWPIPTEAGPAHLLRFHPLIFREAMLNIILTSIVAFLGVSAIGNGIVGAIFTAQNCGDVGILRFLVSSCIYLEDQNLQSLLPYPCNDLAFMTLAGAARASSYCQWQAHASLQRWPCQWCSWSQSSGEGRPAS